MHLSYHQEHHIMRVCLIILGLVALLQMPFPEQVDAEDMMVSDVYDHEEVLLRNEDHDSYIFSIGGGQEVAYSFTIMRGPDVSIFLVEGSPAQYENRSMVEYSTTSPTAAFSRSYSPGSDSPVREFSLVIVAANRTGEVQYHVHITIRDTARSSSLPMTMMALFGGLFLATAAAFLIFMFFGYKRQKVRDARVHHRELAGEEEVIELGSHPRGSIDPYHARGKGHG